MSPNADWVHGALSEGRTSDLTAYRRLAPHAAEAHPQEDHFMPLFVANRNRAAPLLPHLIQVKPGSMSDNLTSSGQRSGPLHSASRN